MYTHVLHCTGLDCRVSWVQIPPEGAHFTLWKSDYLGCAVLLCLVVCLTLLASFFLPSASLTNMYLSSTCVCVLCVCVCVCACVCVCVCVCVCIG